MTDAVNNIPVMVTIKPVSFLLIMCIILITISSDEEMTAVLKSRWWDSWLIVQKDSSPSCFSHHKLHYV